MDPNRYLDEDLMALGGSARRFASERIAPSFQERDTTRVLDRTLMRDGGSGLHRAGAAGLEPVPRAPSNWARPSGVASTRGLGLDGDAALNYCSVPGAERRAAALPLADSLTDTSASRFILSQMWSRLSCEP
jgi:hypothetical protein